MQILALLSAVSFVSAAQFEVISSGNLHFKRDQLPEDVTLEKDYVPIALRVMMKDPKFNSTIHKRADSFTYAVVASKTLTTSSQELRVLLESYAPYGPQTGGIARAFDQLKTLCGPALCTDEYSIPSEIKTQTTTGVRGVTIHLDHKLGPDYNLMVNAKYATTGIRDLLVNSLVKAVGKFDQSSCYIRKVSQPRNLPPYLYRHCDFKTPKFYSIAIFKSDGSIHSYLDVSITNQPLESNSNACAIITAGATAVVGLIDPILGVLGAMAGSVVCN